MKILHTYCLNYNLGDYALGYGVKKVLRELLPIDFIAETNLQGQIFDEHFIETVNQKYDLLVIGGGGIIHGAHWPQGWFWLIEKQLIQHLKIPFVVFAAGYNYFKNEQGIPERGVTHLLETERLARLFSVRNDGSHARLKAQTGIDAKVIADPGFWVGRGQNFPNPPHLKDKYVIVQLANDKPESRFNNTQIYNQFVHQMRCAVEELSRQYHVVMAPHVYDDIAISNEVSRGIENVSIWPFSDFAFDKVESIFGYYQHAECVLAMRGHGQILPLSFRVPTISLENHHKHRELMENMGLGEFNLDVADPAFSHKVVDLADLSISRRTYIAAHLDRVLNELWTQTRETITAVFPS